MQVQLSNSNFNTKDFLSADSFDIEERERYELPIDQLNKLRLVADECGIDFLPLDLQSVEDLDNIGVKLFKIASMISIMCR